MKQEDKELLLKDICGRLPYGLVLDVDTADWKAPQGHIQLKIEDMIKVKEKDKLRFYFGRDPEDRHTYDFIVDWPMMQMGKADASYLLSCVFTKEVREELARRGYDLTTIKFSIAPKLENPTRPERFQELIEKYCKED